MTNSAELTNLLDEEARGKFSASPTPTWSRRSALGLLGGGIAALTLSAAGIREKGKSKVLPQTESGVQFAQIERPVPSGENLFPDPGFVNITESGDKLPEGWKSLGASGKVKLELGKGPNNTGALSIASYNDGRVTVLEAPEIALKDANGKERYFFFSFLYKVQAGDRDSLPGVSIKTTSDNPSHEFFPIENISSASSAEIPSGWKLAHMMITADPRVKSIAPIFTVKQGPDGSEANFLIAGLQFVQGFWSDNPQKPVTERGQRA